MALFNFFHETEADSAYDKSPIRYFDAYRLTNKGGASYYHFSIRYIHTYTYTYEYAGCTEKERERPDKEK